MFDGLDQLEPWEEYKIVDRNGNVVWTGVFTQLVYAYDRVSLIIEGGRNAIWRDFEKGSGD